MPDPRSMWSWLIRGFDGLNERLVELDAHQVPIDRPWLERLERQVLTLQLLLDRLKRKASTS